MTSKASDVLRSPVQWFGGKGNLLPQLAPLVPSGGRPYAEPYAGGASLLFVRDPAPVEALNDLDGDLVALYRVLQDRERFLEFRHRVSYTLYARREFERALAMLQSSDPSLSEVDRAWAKFVAHNMGFSSTPRASGNWSRNFTERGGMSSSTNRWIMRIAMLDAWHWRLMRVQIDCVCALDFLRYWDNEEAVFYVDPPYVQETRKKRDAYRVEASLDHHQALVERLLAARGAVVLSGYDHEVYRPLVEAGWEKILIDTVCHAVGKIRGSGRRGNSETSRLDRRVEVVWRNPKAREALPHERS